MGVILYTLPRCPRCLILKSYLNSLKIPYEEKNAQDFIVYLTSHGFSSAPILEVDGQLYDFISIHEVIYILRERGYSV